MVLLGFIFFRFFIGDDDFSRMEDEAETTDPLLLPIEDIIVDPDFTFDIVELPSEGDLLSDEEDDIQAETEE